jgi:hypothetical protein
VRDYVEQRDGGYNIAEARSPGVQGRETPETILRSFPMAVPLTRVYGAIAFYLENKDQIEA